VPDHSTFSKNRYGRFQESDVYRTLFEQIVEQCRDAGLVAGEGFAVDGSFIHGDASRERRVETLDTVRGLRPQGRYVNVWQHWMPAIRRMRASLSICH
jgi:hypothetical protein